MPAGYESPYKTDRRFCVCRDSLNNIFYPSWIVSFNASESAAEYCVLNVKDVEIVFRHLLHCVSGHIVRSEPNGFSDAMDDSSRHLVSLPTPHELS